MSVGVFSNLVLGSYVERGHPRGLALQNRDGGCIYIQAAISCDLGRLISMGRITRSFCMYDLVWSSTDKRDLRDDVLLENGAAQQDLRCILPSCIIDGSMMKSDCSGRDDGDDEEF